MTAINYSEPTIKYVLTPFSVKTTSKKQLAAKIILCAIHALAAIASIGLSIVVTRKLANLVSFKTNFGEDIAFFNPNSKKNTETLKKLGEKNLNLKSQLAKN